MVTKRALEQASKTLIDNGYDADYLSDNMAFSFLYDCKQGKHKLTKAFLTLFPEWLNIDDPKEGNLMNSAVESGKLTFVKYLVKKGAPMNLRDKSGDTPLQTAINWKRRKIAKYLLEVGANPNNTAKNGYTTLTKAIKTDNWTEVVDLMLEKGVTITPDDILFVILDYKKNHSTSKLNALKKLFEHGANPNPTDYKYPLLYTATTHDLHNVVKILLDVGADIEYKNKNGWTSWMYAKHYKNDKSLQVLENYNAKTYDLSAYSFLEAAKSGDIETVKEALANGVDIELKNDSGITALYRAISNNYYEIAYLLLDKGANPNVIDDNYAPITFAATSSKTDQSTKLKMVKRLIKAGANPNEGKHGSKAFYYAIFHKNYEVAELLYQAGADINSINRFDEDLLLKAVSKNNLKMFDFVVERGIHINGSRGLDKGAKSSPINYAASEDNLEMVKRLVALNADVDNKNYLGNTALMRCADRKDGKNRGAIAHELIKGGANPWIRQDTNVHALTMAKWQKDHPMIEIIQQAATWDKVDYQALTANMTMKKFNQWIRVGAPIVAKKIIDAGFDFNNFNANEDDSPIYVAAYQPSSNLFHYLLEKGADPSLHPLAALMFDDEAPINLEQLADLRASDSSVVEFLEYEFDSNWFRSFKKDATEEEANATWNCIDYQSLIKNMTMEDFNQWIEIAPHQVIQNIVEAGFDINNVKEHQTPPLITIANISNELLPNDLEHFRRTNIFRLLIENGANPLLHNGSSSALGNAAKITSLQNDSIELITNIEAMRALIEHGADVNQWIAGSTPLSTAASAKSYDAVKFLLENGANPNITKAGYGPLYRAVQKRDYDIVKLLLEYGANPNCKGSYQAKTPLDEANKKNLKKIAAILSKYTDIDIRDDKGRTPLFKACMKGDIPQINELIAKGASLDVSDADDVNLRRYGSLRADVAAVIDMDYEPLNAKNIVGELSVTMSNLLISHELPEKDDFDINETDYRGDTLLHHAVVFGNVEIIERLINLGADVFAKNKVGETPILKSVAIGNDEVKAFFDSKNIKPKNEKPLDAVNNQAAMYGRIEDFEKHLIAGDLRQVNQMLDDNLVSIHQLRRTSTPLTLAINHCDLEMVKLLAQKGASLQVCSYSDLSPLYFAVSRNNNADIVQYLLDNGADKDPFCERALMNAIMINNRIAIEQLIKANIYIAPSGTQTYLLKEDRRNFLLEIAKKYQKTAFEDWVKMRYVVIPD